MRLRKYVPTSLVLGLAVTWAGCKPEDPPEAPGDLGGLSVDLTLPADLAADPGDLGPAAPPLSKYLVWAVGSGGVAYRCDGKRWSQVPTGTTADLYGVWVHDDKNAWAVGDRGTLLRWDGVRWQALPTMTTGSLRWVHGSGPDNVWATGFFAPALRWNGTSLKSYQPASGLNEFGAVAAIAPDRAAACGKPMFASSKAARLQLFSGTSFTDSLGFGGQFARCQGVWAADKRLWVQYAEDVASPGSGGLEQYDGMTWSPVGYYPLAVPTSITGRGPNRVYSAWVPSVRDNTMPRYTFLLDVDGGTATRDPLSKPAASLWAAGPDDLFALTGEDLARWNGSDAFVAVPNPLADRRAPLRAVHGVALP